MLEWLLFAGLARAEPVTVVTFDNGEFNAPLYSPRWNGRWRQPSVAQEMATSIARGLGSNPRVYTYMPPGRAPGRPGELHPVPAVRPGCDGPSEHPDDVCWCSPADNCWTALAANYHPEGSTSLVRTATAVRAALRAEGHDGERFEIHFTDFFEEDPSTAENPADSDRCVTASGVRRAIGALLEPGEGPPLDHVAFGLVRLSIDAPPPGGGWGNTYRLVPADGACWSGAKGRSWSHGAEAMDLVLGVVVLGFGTGADPEAARDRFDGMEAQFHDEGVELRLVTLLEPGGSRHVDTALTSLDADPWRMPALRPPPRVPCGAVDVEAELGSAQGQLVLHDVQGRCDGQVGISFAPGELRRHFLANAGLDPRIGSLPVSGRITLTARTEALTARLGSLDVFDDAERPLPLWRAAAEAVDPAAGSVVRPWRHEVVVDRLEVTGLDSRPWLLVSLVACVVGLLGGLGTAAGLQQVHASRALRAAYEASSREDPLRQRPLAAILADAQQQVARGWVARALTGTLVGCVVSAATFWCLLTVYGMLLG